MIVQNENTLTFVGDTDAAEIKAAKPQGFAVFDPRKNTLTLMSSSLAGDYHSTQSAIAADFKKIADAWEEETAHLSIDRQRVSNMNFLHLVSLGKESLPLVFERLRDDEDSAWIVLLRAITFKNPAEDTTGYSQTVEKWFEWGRENGYCS